MQSIEFDETWGPVRSLSWDPKAGAWYLQLRTASHFASTGRPVAGGITVDYAADGSVFGVEGL